MIFGHALKWDTLSIQAAMCNYLEKKNWDVSTSMGFSDKGQSAFISIARKNKSVIIIYLENDAKQIRIKAGIDGKYLPEGQKKPKYSKTFPHTQVKQASDYFEKIVQDLS